MSRTVKAKIIFLILVLGVLPFLEVGALGPLRPAPEPCNYCNQDGCGCQSQPGCTLGFSCACSSLTCIQTCNNYCD